MDPILQGLFQFDITVTTACPNCNDRHIDIETHNYLGIDWQHVRANGLRSLLRRATFTPEVHDDRHCEKCNQKNDWLKYKELRTLPDILVTQLMRFNFSASGTMQKDTTKIRFEDFLDLTPFTENHPNNAKYELIGVIHHIGDVNSGHYKAVVKGPRGKWEEVEDSVVRDVRVKAALDPAKPWTPYVLFWARMEVTVEVTR